MSRLSILNKLPGLIVKIASNKHSWFVFIMVRHKKLHTQTKSLLVLSMKMNKERNVDHQNSTENKLIFFCYFFSVVSTTFFFKSILEHIYVREVDF